MNFLKEILQRLTCFIPRPLQLTEYEAGVRVSFGKWNKVITKGWFWYIPLFQRIIYMEVQTQVVDLRGQSVQSKDGSSVVVSGAIQYSISDIYKAIFNVQDVDKSLETLALGIILEYMKNKNLEECHDITSLKNEIREGIHEAAFGWGLKIEEVYITDLDRTFNLRLIGER